MEYGAIDLHKKESQVRIVTESGEVLDRRIATTRERFTAVRGTAADAHSTGGLDRQSGPITADSNDVKQRKSLSGAD